MRAKIVATMIIAACLLCMLCSCQEPGIDVTNKTEETEVSQESIRMFKEFKDTGEQLVTAILKEDAILFEDGYTGFYIGEVPNDLMNNIRKFKNRGDEVLVFTDGRIDTTLSSETIANVVESNEEILTLLVKLESYGFIDSFYIYYPEEVCFANRETTDEFIYNLNPDYDQADIGYPLDKDWRLRRSSDYLPA